MGFVTFGSVGVPACVTNSDLIMIFENIAGGDAYATSNKV